MTEQHITENAEKRAEKQQVGIPFTGADDPRRWKKGRPAGTKNFSTLFKKAIKKIAESQGTEDTEIEVDLVLKAITEAKKGKFSYHKDIFDRVYGQAEQKHDITSGGEQILGINYIVPRKK